MPKRVQAEQLVMPSPNQPAGPFTCSLALCAELVSLFLLILFLSLRMQDNRCTWIGVLVVRSGRERLIPTPTPTAFDGTTTTRCIGIFRNNIVYIRGILYGLARYIGAVSLLQDKFFRPVLIKSNHAGRNKDKLQTASR